MKTSIAVLFAYDGTQFDGLERERLNKESKTVEQALFKAFPRDTTSITHISRASLTGAHEHAAKQVISLNYGGEEIPEVEAVNAQLATEAIKVFKIIPVDKDFSARRTCEARTVEVLIPVFDKFNLSLMSLLRHQLRLITVIQLSWRSQWYLKIYLTSQREAFSPL